MTDPKELAARLTDAATLYSACLEDSSKHMGVMLEAAAALLYLVDNFPLYDFIWARPPCQSHSRMLAGGQNRKPRLTDMSLWQVILFCQQYVEVPWCVENVVPRYKPFIEPTGEASRHLFWSNYSMDFPPQIDAQPPVWDKCNLEGKAEMEQWLGLGETPTLYYTGNHNPVQVLQNCLHPELGKWALECAL